MSPDLSDHIIGQPMAHLQRFCLQYPKVYPGILFHASVTSVDPMARTQRAEVPVDQVRPHRLNTQVDMRFAPGNIAENIGKGLIAGLFGTAVMTVSSTIEMKIRGRQPSDTPARAAGKVLGVAPTGDEEKERFSTFVHWDYGMSWGFARGLISTAGLKGAPASGVHFLTVWGTALWMLPALKVTPPPTEWGWKEVAIDAFHHAVYAAATGLAYDYLDGRGKK